MQPGSVTTGLNGAESLPKTRGYCHSPGCLLTPEEMTSLIEPLHVGLLCGKLTGGYHFLFEINGIWPFFERRGTDFIEMNDVNALVVTTRRKIWTGYLFISIDQLYYTYIQSIILESEILRLCHFRTP